MTKYILPLLLFLAISSSLPAQTWILQGAGFTSNSRGIMNFSCVSSQVVWASAYDGSGAYSPVQDFTRTTNGGTTWTAGVVSNAAGLQTSMITAVDANTAWAAMYWMSGSNSQGIYKTVNGGSTWTRQTTAYFNDSYSFPDCVYFWDAGNGVCIGDPTSSGEFEIYTTTNGGTTWTSVPGSQIPDPLSNEYGLTANYAVNGNNIWFGTSQGRVFASTDRGYHWTVASVPGMTGYNAMPAFSSGSNGLALKSNTSTDTLGLLGASTNGGIGYTTSSYTGSVYTNDIKYVPLTANTFVTAGSDGNYQSSRLGLTWSYNGGQTWYTDQFLYGTQVTASGWIDANTGWAGTFNSGTSDGIYKMTQGAGGTQPVAAFTTADTSISPGAQAHFLDQSTGPPASWLWTFPGSVEQTSTQENPVITYNNTGTYDVTLQVTNAYGNNSLTKHNYIHVTGPAYLPPANLHVTVTGNNVHITWDAPPGTPGPTGYNVYMSGSKLNASPVTVLFYDVYSLPDGTYYFSVYSVYGSTEYTGVGPALAMVGMVTLTVGDTEFDGQSNGSVQERFYLYDDGEMGAAWTYGTAYSTFPERGTGYNFQDGSGWNPSPVSRIESIRTGWPCYQPWNGGGEIVIAHQANPSLVMSTRPVRGTGSWTPGYISPPSGAPGLAWPRMITSGVNHNYIHLLVMTKPYASGGSTYQGLDGALLYYRSPDGGVTWDKAGVIPEQLSSAHYQGFSADNYAWGAPHGDTLVFAAGGHWTDTFIMKSTDNGNTWTKIPILNNGNIWHTAYTYTPPFYCCDGSLCVEMDHQGRYHVVFGRMRAGDDGNGPNYYPGTDGLVYWNSDMPMLDDSLDMNVLEANGQLMGYVPANASGDTVVGFPIYGVGLSSFPQISIDSEDGIFVIWSGLTVGNPYNGSQNYRHLRGRGSWDHGSSWSDMIDLSTQPIDAGKEFCYPAMAKNTTGSLHILYQSADIPGSAVKDPAVPYHFCDVFHRSIPKSLFPPNAPVTTAGTVIVCPNSAITIPVTVNRFSNIKSMSLRIEYDPAIMTFSPGTSSINSGLAGAAIVNLPVGGGSPLNKLMLTWNGATPQSLSNGAVLASLGFNYLSGTSAISFNNADNGGHDCEYTNADGNPITDTPTATFYVNGQASSGEAGGSVSGGDSITFGQSTGTLMLTGYVGSILKWQKQYDGGGFYDIPATAGSPAYAEYPSFTGTWDYRAVVQYGSCQFQYSVAATVVVKTPAGTPKTWTGSTGDDWSTPTNWSPPGVPFLTDDVVFSANPVHMPVVKNQGLGCKNITIPHNATMTVNPGIILIINGEAVIMGP